MLAALVKSTHGIGRKKQEGISHFGLQGELGSVCFFGILPVVGVVALELAMEEDDLLLAVASFKSHNAFLTHLLDQQLETNSNS
jgi:hypothetical protein